MLDTHFEKELWPPANHSPNHSPNHKSSQHSCRSSRKRQERSYHRRQLVEGKGKEKLWRASTCSSSKPVCHFKQEPYAPPRRAQSRKQRCREWPACPQQLFSHPCPASCSFSSPYSLSHIKCMEGEGMGFMAWRWEVKDLLRRR